jgi:hypothetical protein
MNKLPKLKDLDPPQGYFEKLPDEILDSLNHSSYSASWIKYAAAAVILISLGIWQLGGLFQTEPKFLTLEEEAALYIDSQVWTDEDVLGMMEDPNAILDEMLTELLPSEEILWQEEEQNWF